MNKATTIDQELKQYLENIEKGQAENTAENLYNLRNRYGFDIKTSYSDAHECLKKIYDIQVQSDEILNPIIISFEEDGVLYHLDQDAIMKIGDEAYSPISGAIVVIDEENVYFANEEYYRVHKKENLVLKEFDVEICRTAYAHRTIKVKALTFEEACDAALEVAGNYEYSVILFF
jgi:hypothetical protein